MTTHCDDAADDDTIELELTAAELGYLNQAAEAALVAPAEAPIEQPLVVVIPPVIRSPPVPKPTRQWPENRILAALAVVAACAWLLFSQHAKQPPPVVAAAGPAPTTIRSATAIIPVAPVSPAIATVQVRNPFDRSEVFEFPAGTSVADAHDKVAQLLLQRARERLPLLRQARHRARTVGIRTAKN